MCRRKIKNSGIARIVCANEYGGFSAQCIDVKLDIDVRDMLGRLCNEDE